MVTRSAVEPILRPYVPHIAESVWQGASDWQSVRAARPRFAAKLSKQRGLPNVMHDLIWPHLRSNLIPLGATFGDTRTRNVVDRWFALEGGLLQFRLKKHRRGSLDVSAYPTDSHRQFIANDFSQETLFPEGRGQLARPVNLIAGYVLDREALEVGSALISYRCGAKVEWSIPLPRPEPAEDVIVAPRPVDEAPEVSVRHRDDQGAVSSTGDE